MNKAIIKNKIQVNGFISITASFEGDVITNKDLGGYVKWVDSISETKRTVSISKVDETDSTMTLDFVDHGREGKMATWARDCKIGDEFQFMGPGPAANISLNGDDYYFLGDRTAFPAIRVQLERLLQSQSKANLYIGLEGSKEEIQHYFSKYISLPNTHLLSMNESDDQMVFVNLFEEFFNDTSSEKILWCAAERNKVLPMRKLVKEIQSELVDKYISSYWQNGLKDEEHKKNKKLDSAI
ncbi:siderophore-interacting protein [Halobacteriovorax sp. GB3]|uniref:siderophore-interacting protein n=1 Tax=Halobacteriovorax sp. GB3 TaxID=2719615 RepID=UPI00235FF01C|nr:siderophore-interacting protein [Halobacteriovorax sp. GB3]MDD0851531.1 siderophore-interacting protein [Halobacteriovorax sp. GB3]